MCLILVISFAVFSELPYIFGGLCTCADKGPWNDPELLKVNFGAKNTFLILSCSEPLTKYVCSEDDHLLVEAGTSMSMVFVVN